LGGKIPINTSGGLESRGHPIGASGLGQINEIVTQLLHGAGSRQVESCHLGLAENGGGLVNLIPAMVKNLAGAGGCILGTAAQSDPFHVRTINAENQVEEMGQSDEILKVFKKAIHW
jgi:hypothetical protein